MGSNVGKMWLGVDQMVRASVEERLLSLVLLQEDKRLLLCEESRIQRNVFPWMRGAGPITG
jgi:hypothetical protein